MILIAFIRFPFYVGVFNSTKYRYKQGCQSSDSLGLDLFYSPKKCSSAGLDGRYITNDFLYCVGVIPVCFLNTELKEDLELNPASKPRVSNVRLEDSG